MFFRRARKVYDMLDNWKTVKDVALELRCSTKSARNILRSLIDMGLVEEKWVKQGLTSGRWIKVYRRVEQRREEKVRRARRWCYE
jgi:predicted transcriptional regulator